MAIGLFALLALLLVVAVVSMLAVGISAAVARRQDREVDQLVERADRVIEEQMTPEERRRENERRRAVEEAQREAFARFDDGT